MHPIRVLEELEIHVEFVIEIKPVVSVQAVIDVTVDPWISGSIPSVPFDGILVIHTLVITFRVLTGHVLVTCQPKIESRIKNDQFILR